MARRKKTNIGRSALKVVHSLSIKNDGTWTLCIHDTNVKAISESVRKLKPNLTPYRGSDDEHLKVSYA